MRAGLCSLFLVLLAAGCSADVFISADSYESGREEAYYVTDGSNGMLQSFRLDNSGMESMNSLLSRPRMSSFDNSWNSWVEDRLDVLQLVENAVNGMLSPRPRCPHMVQMYADSGLSADDDVIFMSSSEDEEEDSSRMMQSTLTTLWIPAPSLVSSFMNRVLFSPFIGRGVFRDSLSANGDVGYYEVYDDTYTDDGLYIYEEVPMYEAVPVYEEDDDTFEFYTVDDTAEEESRDLFEEGYEGSDQGQNPSQLLNTAKPYTSFTSLVPQDELPSQFSWRIQDGEGNVEGGLILFGLLCFCCLFAFVNCVRSYCRLETEMQRAKAKQNPLIAPLLPEGAKSLKEDLL